MSNLNESEPPAKQHNPLLWISLIVAGLIVYVLVGSDRGNQTAEREVERVGQVERVEQTTLVEPDEQAESVEQMESVEPIASLELDAAVETSNEIERSLLIPPGMRARQYIAEIRKKGVPYPFASIYDKGSSFQEEGSLADAHLVYFFSAREGYIPAMMKMGKMSDPTLFRAENNLLDHADAIQAYKWYQRAAAQGHAPGTDGVNNLQQWAIAEAKLGNPDARQLLLNFK
jgi:TPR repeat protein